MVSVSGKDEDGEDKDPDEDKDKDDEDKDKEDDDYYNDNNRIGTKGPGGKLEIFAINDSISTTF